MSAWHNTAVSRLRTVRVSRYVTPLREGGSLPALVEADDEGLYVLKFRASGHGTRALVAELVAGEIARALGLPIPEIVLADLDRDLSRTEPDPEIHALIHDSAGLNLALDFLPGSFAFDPLVHTIPTDLASRIVWFDALISNVDRTARNTNMLVWHKAPWLIDHGSSLYFHHAPDWQSDRQRPRTGFAGIRDHVLWRQATTVRAVDDMLAATLTATTIDGILALVPDEWLVEPTTHASAATMRDAYRRYLLERLTAPRPFVEEAAGGR